jgi:hypothetical protein
MAVTIEKPKVLQPESQKLKKPRGGNRTRTGNCEAKVSVWVSHELAGAIQAFSKESGLPITEIARKAFRAYMDAHK